MTTKGVMTDKDGVEIAGTQIKPTTVEVRCPTKATPLFSKVKVVVSNTPLQNQIIYILVGSPNLIDSESGRYKYRDLLTHCISSLAGLSTWS